MSLVAPLVSLSVLCGLLAASSSTSVNTSTAPVCVECSNGSASQNTSESGQRNVNSTQRDQQLRLDSLNNGNQDVLLNKTIDNGKQNLTQKINNTTSSSSSSSSSSLPFNISTQEPAKSSDLSAEPEASTGLHSDSINNGLNKSTDVPSNTAAGQANTGVKTSPASPTTLSTPTPTTTTTTTTTTTPLHTPTITVAHAPSTTSSAPSIVTVTSSSNTITQMTKKPAATTATTTNTTTTNTTATSLGFTNSPTVQYLSSVVEVAGQDLTSHLVDTASLLAILLFGLLFFFVIVTLFVTQAYESYRRKDYTQVDYLINGMYSDSGV